MDYRYADLKLAALHFSGCHNLPHKTILLRETCACFSLQLLGGRRGGGEKEGVTERNEPIRDLMVTISMPTSLPSKHVGNHTNSSPIFPLVWVIIPKLDECVCVIVLCSCTVP